MEKIDLIKQFASRLRDALIAAGFSSQRSTSGVNIHQLAEMTGYSPQICRKYLRGQAIPEPAKLVEIAAKLKVSPGWLLFGDSPTDQHDSANKTITLHRRLLHYIFDRADTLYTSYRPKREGSDFLMELAVDISQINASEEQSKKIIDLALSSASHFSR
jgi:transcriptional regulator with XRE-family HTH domain